MATTTRHTLRTAQAARDAGPERQAAKAISLAIDQGRDEGTNTHLELAEFKAETKASLAEIKASLQFIFWAFGLVIALLLGNMAMTAGILLR